jgi:prepilin-type N-terminal cleavage/methylation domain-containing protein
MASVVVRVMPRISGFCLLSPEARLRRGFSLLELLVVLMLVALTTGLVLPSFLTRITASRESAVAHDLVARLEGLPVQAFQRAESMVVDADQLRRMMPDLPADWQLHVEPALHYAAVGLSSGGTVRLTAPGRKTLVWRIAPVSGEVSALTTRASTP